MPITYEVLDRSTSASKGMLGAKVVGKEPDFIDNLNSGPSELQIQVDRLPEYIHNLSDFDLIKITNHDGTVEGIWKFEKQSGDESIATQYLLHLLPLMEELASVDFEANYSSAADEDGQPPLGSAKWSVPIHAALPRTKHCTAGVIQDDGLNYDFTFRARLGRVQDTLNRGIDFGGPDWWWFADGQGVCELRHGPRNVVTILYNDHVAWQQPGRDSTAVINCQRVIGGNLNILTTDPSTGISYEMPTPILSFIEKHDGPYGIDAIGRRVAQPWRDPGIMSQASNDALCAALIARHNTPATERVLRLLPSAPIVRVGDQVVIRYNDGTVVGPLWCKTTRKFGSSGVRLLTLASAIDYRERPFRARNAAMNAMQSGALVPGSSFVTAGVAACGGYQPLARSIPGTMSGAATGPSFIPVSVNFVLDSSGNCQIDARFIGSIKWTRTNPTDSPVCGVQLGVGTGGSDMSGAASVVVPFEADDAWQPLHLSVPSGRQLADGTYSIFIQLNGPAGTYELAYDLQAWLYAGGVG